EVKFRKKGYTPRELISQCVDILRNREQARGGKTYFLLIVFSYDDLSGLERNLYRFSKNMEETYHEFIDTIHFIPCEINNLQNLKDDLGKFKNSIAEKKFETFILENQSINPTHPTIDDHYYPKIFNTNNRSHEITFQPLIPMRYWRFGIKFSMSTNFPPVEQ